MVAGKTSALKIKEDLNKYARINCIFKIIPFIKHEKR